MFSVPGDAHVLMAFATAMADDFIVGVGVV